MASLKTVTSPAASLWRGFFLPRKANNDYSFRRACCALVKFVVVVQREISALRPTARTFDESFFTFSYTTRMRAYAVFSISPRPFLCMHNEERTLEKYNKRFTLPHGRKTYNSGCKRCSPLQSCVSLRITQFKLYLFDVSNNFNSAPSRNSLLRRRA